MDWRGRELGLAGRESGSWDRRSLGIKMKIIEGRVRVAASDVADEAPRGLDFLYDPHRLNVATSRARAMAIIVASPDLIRVSCRTPHQMTLANALCRAWETGG